MSARGGLRFFDFVGLRLFALGPRPPHSALRLPSSACGSSASALRFPPALSLPLRPRRQPWRPRPPPHRRPWQRRRLRSSRLRPSTPWRMPRPCLLPRLTFSCLPARDAGSSRPFGATMMYTTAPMNTNVDVNELMRIPVSAMVVAWSLRISSIQNRPRRSPATYIANSRPWPILNRLSIRSAPRTPRHSTAIRIRTSDGPPRPAGPSRHRSASRVHR